eukprot:TRINITY_DN3401_c0_g2_i4.p1 TRINITY_DN3401_c0_g2~~TRINITY_DN3401_c0_g2_i4.p1  ORF type:complete len:291 (+),score=69.24 TRINITY_DN3401_c0_g2_i4:56-928(+)
MTLVLFFGCLFVTFGPALALFFLFIANNNQLIILTIGGSFFWLLSILVASLWWFIIPPLRTTFAFVIPFSVLFQELGRYAFYRLFDWGFSASTRPPTLPSSSSSLSNNNSNPNPANNNGDSSQPAAAQPSSAASELERRRAVMRENARLRSLAQMPNRLASATALGLGSGITYALVMYTSVLWEASGPGSMFSQACPNTSLFMVSALITSLFVVLHVFLSIIGFEGFRTKNKALMASAWVIHLVAAFLTMANLNGGNCAGSIIPIFILVVLAGIVTRWAVLRSGFVRVKD